MENGQPVPGSLFFYAPNKGAPIFFAIAFGLSTAWHLWQCIKYRSWRITGLLPFLGAIFTAGYILREIGAFHYTSLSVYIGTQILLYMAPPILELANYHIFGRVLYYVPYCSPIHPGRTLTTFGLLSSIVEVLNGIGVAWTANSNLSDSMLSAASAVLKASLIIQIVVIAFFLSMVLVFHLRCRKCGVTPRQVWVPIWCLYISSFLILVRCIYRTVEHFSNDGIGKNSTTNPLTWSPIIRYEWFFYVFEAVLMLVVVVGWNVLHPRKFLPENYHVYLARDGESEVIGDGWRDDRSFLVTVLDPFGFWATRPKEQKPFWELDGIEPNYVMRTKM